jgi:hypothetical protein
MNQSFYGSIDITRLLKELKTKHSGFYKGNNGHIYANTQVWLNETPDKFGNVLSVKINPSKEKKDIEKAFYLGNCKKSDGPKPMGDNDIPDVNLDEIDPLPHQQHPATPTSTEDDGLPF